MKKNSGLDYDLLLDAILDLREKTGISGVDGVESAYKSSYPESKKMGGLVTSLKSLMSNRGKNDMGLFQAYSDAYSGQNLKDSNVQDIDSFGAQFESLLGNIAEGSKNEDGEVSESGIMSLLLPLIIGGSGVSSGGFGSIANLFKSQGFSLGGLATIPPNGVVQHLEGAYSDSGKGDQTFGASTANIGYLRYFGNAMPMQYSYGGTVVNVPYPSTLTSPLMPIQAEKGEVAVWPDFSVVDMKAKKPHEDMDDSEVTDLVPVDETYILSNRVFLKRSDIENAITTYSLGVYKENSKGRDIRENKIVEVFDKIAKKLKKDKISVAEFVKGVRGEFPIIEDTDDIFINEANKENRSSREPYVMIAIDKNEKYRIKQALKHFEKELERAGFKGDKDVDLQDLQLEEGEVGEFKYGGKVVDKKNPVKKGIGGDLVEAFSKIFGGNRKDRKAIEKEERLFKEMLAKYPEYFDKSRDLKKDALNKSSVASLLSTIGQDPSETAVDYTKAFAANSQLPGEISNALKQSAFGQNRALAESSARALSRNAGSFSDAILASGALNARANEDNSRLALDFANREYQMAYNKALQLQNLSEKEAVNLASVDNAERDNKNIQLASVGAIGSNYFTQDAAIENDRIAQDMRLMEQEFAGTQAFNAKNKAWREQRASTWGSAVDGAAQVAAVALSGGAAGAAGAAAPTFGQKVGGFLSDLGYGGVGSSGSNPTGGGAVGGGGTTSGAYGANNSLGGAGISSSDVALQNAYAMRNNGYGNVLGLDYYASPYGGLAIGRPTPPFYQEVPYTRLDIPDSYGGR